MAAICTVPFHKSPLRVLDQFQIMWTSFESDIWSQLSLFPVVKITVVQYFLNDSIIYQGRRKKGTYKN